MTPRIVSLFPDRSSAAAAVSRLTEAGAAAADVELHEGAVHASNATSVALDEAVTGGIVGNFAALFAQLMQSEPVGKTEAVTYAETVRQEGTIVSVILRDPSVGERLGKLLRDGGATRIARLPQPGLNDGDDSAGQKHGAETRT